MITMKDIVREGNPILNKSVDAVETPLNEENKELLNEMITFLKNSQDETIAEKYNLRPGVGLAAPQLGLNKRLVAVHFEDQHDKLYSYGLVNPKIISHSVEMAYMASGEGCLSVDRQVEGYVPRYARVTVKATDMEGTPIKLRLKGYAAVVFQHEIDHINGIMFYDHINKQQPYVVPEGAKPID